MSALVHLLPVGDRLVRMPGTGQRLPADGAAVELDTYWHRRLSQGDVVRAPVPVRAKAKKPKE